MGTFLITETMNQRHQLDMRSYDRLFPNQDTLPKGGFGNLIALPLQKIPMENGNSVFISENFIPYTDQWAYLSSVKRMTLNVAMLQSLDKQGEVDIRIKNYGHIIVDECHHISAVSFERVMMEANARYIIGLTATPYRRDGHQPIIIMQCGPIRYKIRPQSGDESSFSQKLITRFTNFSCPWSDEDTINSIWPLLITDEGRNQMICFDDLRLDTLFLVMPFSFKGKIVQYAGRLHRNYKGKTEVRIYDYIDNNMPVLQRMYKRRLKTYKALGYVETPSL
jgi:hypothetical protein